MTINDFGNKIITLDILFVFSRDIFNIFWQFFQILNVQKVDFAHFIADKEALYVLKLHIKNSGKFFLIFVLKFRCFQISIYEIFPVIKFNQFISFVHYGDHVFEFEIEVLHQGKFHVSLKFMSLFDDAVF